MNPLVLLGLVLAAAALLFVVYPVFKGASGRLQLQAVPDDLEGRRRALYGRILEIELDRQLGKLTESDAREQSEALLRQAAELLASQTAADRLLELELEHELAVVRKALLAEPESQLQAISR